MKNLKRSLAILLAVLMMASVLAACSSKEDTKSDASDPASTVETTATTTTADDTPRTITEDEAIELVKQKMGAGYSYIPASELEEIDGSQYYVIYVKTLLETGNYTTLATYLVKTDGSEVFDKDANGSTETNDTDASSYVGEYVHSGTTGEITFTVFEDGSFKMTTTGVVKQVVSGVYQFGITNSASVIKLILFPREIVTETDGETTEEDVTGREGTATIEDGKLTLAMESEDTVFTKK